MLSLLNTRRSGAAWLAVVFCVALLGCSQDKPEPKPLVNIPQVDEALAVCQQIVNADRETLEALRTGDVRPQRGLAYSVLHREGMFDAIQSSPNKECNLLAGLRILRVGCLFREKKTFGPQYFYDYATLVWHEGQWRLVAIGLFHPKLKHGYEQFGTPYGGDDLPQIVAAIKSQPQVAAGLPRALLADAGCRMFNPLAKAREELAEWDGKPLWVRESYWFAVELPGAYESKNDVGCAIFKTPGASDGQAWESDGTRYLPRYLYAPLRSQIYDEITGEIDQPTASLIAAMFVTGDLEVTCQKLAALPQEKHPLVAPFLPYARVCAASWEEEHLQKLAAEIGVEETLER